MTTRATISALTDKMDKVANEKGALCFRSQMSHLWGLENDIRMFVVIFEIVTVVTKKQDLHLIHSRNATF